MSKTDKFNVLVLTDNEENTKYLYNFSYKEPVPSPHMCIVTHKTEMFVYHTLNINTIDKKIDEYARSRDGIIISINDMAKVKENRIDKIIKENEDKPILIVMFDKNIGHVRNLQKYRSDKNHIISLDLNTTNYFDEKELMEQYRVIDNSKKWFVEKMDNNTVSLSKDNTLNSKTIDMDEMVRQFENKTMPIKLWNHYGRLRMVLYSLKKYGFKDTVDYDSWLCKTWRAYKTSIGHKNLWNYSLTRFWACILYKLYKTDKSKDISYWMETKDFLSNGNLHKDFYDFNVLFSDYARENWVEPTKFSK